MSSDSLSSSSSSSTSTNHPRYNPRRRLGVRTNFFNLEEAEFKARFRFTKESVRFILNKIKRKLPPQRIARRDCITPMMQLLIALRFYATGSFQQVIGDTAKVSKASVCRIVGRVSHVLALLKTNIIKMPTIEECPNNAAEFFALAGFPRVVGAIDCTHIKIMSPGGNRAELYRNRKGFFSVNVQVVADAKLKIRNIIARWPGSAHDTTIWNDSPLAAEFEAGRYGQYCLLGDSGYPCLRYLLTPFLNCTTAGQEAYNRAQISTRTTVERCFGVLKRRFACLHVGMQLKLPKIYRVIVACAVLHNMAIDLEDQILEPDEFEPEEEIGGINLASAQNFSVRNALVADFFS